MTDISPHAIVESSADLAPDVRVGPFAYVGPHVRIGPGCVIGNNATITGRTVLGASTRVSPLSVVGTAPQGADDGDGQCILGEANVVREHVTICAGRDEPTRIGKNNLIMIGSQIDAGAQVGDHGIFANFTQIGGAARVEDYVRASGFTLIGAGVTVGAYSFTAGYVTIDHNAPPFAMLQGTPFRVRGVNTHNLRRCGFGQDDVRALKSAFRELFNGSGHVINAEALDRLWDTGPRNPHVRRLVEFLRDAPRPPLEAEDG